jgi:hypothetical protein
MAKKIQLEFDIDSKDVKIVGGELLSLTQQLRVFKKEIQDPNLSQENFEILRKKIGDVEDGIARTSTKSRDFFSVLSTLPGPIGAISSSLSGAIDTLKIFSSFSLKDIKNSFLDVIDDIGDVIKNLLGLNSATKAQTAATTAQTTATNAATVATEGQAVATNVLTTAEKQATIASKALRLALTALGIGAVIFLLTELIPLITEWVTGTKAAEDANKKLEDSFKSLQNSIVETQNAIKDNTDLALLDAKIQGKSAKELFEIQKKGLEDRVAANKKAYQDITKQNLDLLSNTKITEEQRQKLQEDINKAIADNTQQSNNLRIEGEKIVRDEQLRIAEESRQKQEEIRNKGIQDTKAANDKLRALIQENGLLIIEDERQRALAQLEITKKNEEDAINLLKISREKRNELLSQIDRNFRIKTQQTNKKFDEEDAKAREDFRTKIQQLEISLIQDETKRLTKERELQFKKEKQELIDSDGFKKAQKEEQNNAIIALERRLQDDLTKISEDGENKRLDNITSNGNKLNEQLKGINDRLLLTTNKTQSDILNLTDTLDGYLDMQIDKLIEYADKFGGQVLRSKYGVESLRDLYELIFASNKKAIDDNEKQLIQSYEKNQKELKNQYESDVVALKFQLDTKQISQQKYNEEIINIENNSKLRLSQSDENYAIRQKEINDLRLNNQSDYNNKIIQLDNILLDARRQNADATIQVAENVAALLTAVAGNSVKGQKQAAIVEGLVSIARVIIDTQRANVAFAASVAPLGPAGVPIAASYALKNQISAALAIATITAQGINRIKQIDANAADTQGGQQSNRLGRGYEEGGLIGGKRHSQGGTIIEAERGEAIMTRGAVTMFAPMLSMMNQMGGGVSFSSNLSTARPDMPLVSNPSQEQQPLIVKTYVVENEMTSTQQKQARLKDLSTL